MRGLSPAEVVSRLEGRPVAPRHGIAWRRSSMLPALSTTWRRTTVADVSRVGGQLGTHDAAMGNETTER
ncbi:hypothetical protein ABZ532_30560 [Streptomyces sp. NPDC019396]|uniref:hypothetical protein n=1 Tax=Streptomyces sp. NPDC019396 TaxID=3154687 RepID=UPI0033C00EDC